MNPNKKNNDWLTIVSMALFIFMALGVVIFFYNQNQELKKIIVDYKNMTLAPSPTPITIFMTASPSATPKKSSAKPLPSPSQ